MDKRLTIVDLAASPDLEDWARRTIEEAPISAWEFSENLPRIGWLARVYGLEPLREIIVTMTSAGLAFSHVLMLLERGDVPPPMQVDVQALPLTRPNMP